MERLDVNAWPFSRGEMASRVREFQWGSTALGGLESWPQSLRIAVDLVLGCPLPMIAAWGPELNVCAYNDAYRPLLGRKPEVLGRRFLDVWSEARQTLVPLIEKVWKGESVYFSAAPFLLTRNDYPEQTYFDFSLSPLRDDAGRIAGLLNATLEATERVEALRSLAESEARYRALAELSPDAVLVHIGDKFTYANPAALRVLRAHDPSDVIGHSPLEFVEPEYHELSRDRVRSMLETGGAAPRVEYRCRAIDGTLIEVEIAASPVDWLGSPAIQVVVRDITERKNQERALHASHAELERLVHERTAELQETVSQLETFSYSIAHDMRAPLRTMQSFSDILLDEHAEQLSPDGRNYLHRIARAANRMDRLVMDVLSYSRVVRGELKLEVVRVEELLRELVESYPAFAPENARIVMAAPIPAVMGNNALLTQVFSNLLCNALKFVAPGIKPHVRIWSEAAGGRVRLLVRDNGIGIPAPQHAKIFEIFQQLDSSSGGTGIGLAIVKRAIERMGGEVCVESVPQQGSTFALTLQRADGPEVATPAP